MNILCQTVPLQYDSAFSPYLASEWREAFRDVAKNGFGGVEIAVAYPEQVDAEAVFNEAERYGLKITTISTGQICSLEGAFLTSEDIEKRRIAVNAVKGHVALSAKLGLPHVTIGLLRCPAGTEETKTLEDRLSSVLYPLCIEANESGVMLQLEAINKNEAALFHTSAECAAYIDGLGAPIGQLFDTYHASLEPCGAAAAVLDAGKRISNVHICDSHRGLPTEGNIDFKAVLSALKSVDYNGALALETKCVPTREHVLSTYSAAMRRLF